MENGFMKFTVGQRAAGLAGPEGMMFDVNDAGGLMVVREEPGLSKAEEALEGDALEFGFVEMRGVIFVLLKIKSTIFDAPYSVHLSINLTEPLESVPDGLGYLTSVIFADTDGTVRRIRTVSMSTAFSRKLKKAIEEQAARPFSVMEHQRSISQVYGAYTPDQLWKFASVKCKIGKIGQ